MTTPPSRAHLRRGGIERRLNRGHDAHSPETRRLPGAQTRDREGLEPVSHVDDVGRTAGADGAARIRQRRGVLERRPPGGNGRVVVERRDLDLRDGRWSDTGRCPCRRRQDRSACPVELGRGTPRKRPPPFGRAE